MTMVRVVVMLVIACSLFPEPAVAERRPKDPAVAVAWSAGLTSTGAALFAFAQHDVGDREVVGTAVAGLVLLVGPSIGHMYAGEERRGMTSIGVRALALAGVGSVLSDDGERRTDRAVLATSALVLAATIAADLIDAPSAARRAGPLPPGSRPLVRRRPHVLAAGATAGAALLIGAGGYWAWRTERADDPWFAGVAPGLVAGIVAPSAGHFSTGEWRRGATTSIVRGVAIATGAYALTQYVRPNDDPCYPEDDGCPDGNLGETAAAVTIAAGAILVTTIVDVVDAADAGRRVTLTPAPLPGRAPGLVVAGTF